MIGRSTLPALLGALLGLVACAGGETPGIDTPAALRSSAPRPTACEPEMRAFVALSQLAKRYGDNWTLFQPAIDALRDQILDCVEDSYPTSTGA